MSATLSPARTASDPASARKSTATILLVLVGVVLTTIGLKLAWAESEIQDVSREFLTAIVNGDQATASSLMTINPDRSGSFEGWGELRGVRVEIHSVNRDGSVAHVTAVLKANQTALTTELTLEQQSDGHWLIDEIGKLEKDSLWERAETEVRDESWRKFQAELNAEFDADEGIAIDHNPQ